MAHNIKPRITLKKYAEDQIQKYLDQLVAFEAEKAVVTKTLDDVDKKDNAIKAITAIDLQMKAQKEALKKWEEYYEEIK